MLIIGNIQIIKLLSSKWKSLFLIALIATVVSAIISIPQIIKPKYKSEQTVYPTNLNPYSLESPTEQLMQLFTSRQLKTKMLYQQQLWINYQLDTMDVQFDFFYSQLFDEHIKFTQTKYQTVNIDVYDHDPKKAKQINQGIITALNEMVKTMHDEKTKEFRDMFAFQMNQKKKNIDSAEKVLSELRNKYGILDYYIEVKEAKKNYYKALSKGASSSSLKALQAELKILEEKGGEFKKSDGMYRSEFDEYQKVKKEYEDKIRDLEKKFTYTTIVADANLPVKKAWPVRWLIIVASVFSSVFLGCIYFIVVGRIRNLNNL
jgi:capsule polysaccharide export protein KpsE/RkpR